MISWLNTGIDSSDMLDRVFFMPLSTHGIRIPIIAPAKNGLILRASGVGIGVL